MLHAVLALGLAWPPHSTVDTSTLDVTWKDCGAKHAKVTSIAPKTITLGASTSITGEGELDIRETGGNFSLAMTGVGGVRLLSDCGGDASSSKECKIALGPVNLGTLTFSGLAFPITKGHVVLPDIVKLALPAGLPSFATATTTTLKVTDSNGESLICVEIFTKAA